MISVLTLNVWFDSGPWEKRKILIQDCINQLRPDLIALQEVIRGDNVDQLQEIFSGVHDRYNMEYVKAQQIKSPRSGLVDFGNSVASRWSIEARHVLTLPDNEDGETRAAIAIITRTPFGNISFVSTHLNWKYHHGNIREKQVVAICDWLLHIKGKNGLPPILAGDFNAEPQSSEIRYILGLQSLHGKSICFRDTWEVALQKNENKKDPNGYTWSNKNPYSHRYHEPDRRIDYIFVYPPLIDSGIGKIESCMVVCDQPKDGVWPSDHFGVFARVCYGVRSNL